MAIDSFEEFLKKKNKDEKPIDWALRRKEWLNSIDEFYQNVNNWLTPFIKGSLLNIEKNDMPIYEQYIGHYYVPQLDIRIGNEIVSLTPKGTMIAGARGRIDLRGPKREIIMLEEKWNNWKFTSKYNGDNSWNVNATSFQKAIQDVING
jgi:hypothetical protein